METFAHVGDGGLDLFGGYAAGKGALGEAFPQQHVPTDRRARGVLRGAHEGAPFLGGVDFQGLHGQVRVIGGLGRHSNLGGVRLLRLQGFLGPLQRLDHLEAGQGTTQDVLAHRPHDGVSANGQVTDEAEEGLGVLRRGQEMREGLGWLGGGEGKARCGIDHCPGPGVDVDRGDILDLVALSGDPGGGKEEGRKLLGVLLWQHAGRGHVHVPVLPLLLLVRIKVRVPIVEGAHFRPSIALGLAGGQRAGRSIISLRGGGRGDHHALRGLGLGLCTAAAALGRKREADARQHVAPRGTPQHSQGRMIPRATTSGTSRATFAAPAA